MFDFLKGSDVPNKTGIYWCMAAILTDSPPAAYTCDFQREFNPGVLSTIWATQPQL